MADHVQSGCPLCEPFQPPADGKPVCDTCHGPLGPTPFRAVSVDHFHEEVADEVKGLLYRTPVCRTLCPGCYLEDFAANYPGQPLPELTASPQQPAPQDHGPVPATATPPAPAHPAHRGYMDQGCAIVVGCGF